jgi:tetratricopeptide (TPR) repeat protein
MTRFKEALEKRPGYAEAYLYMAQVQALRGEYAEAEKSLRLILNSGIETSDIHSWMAYVLVQTKQKAEAQKHIARAIELDNPSPAAQWSRTNQHAVAGAS